MTEERILELATYHFYKGSKVWSGVTDKGIIEFANTIRVETLGRAISKLEELQ